MANQKASLIKLKRPESQVGMAGKGFGSPSFNVVLDSYSSKYYGSETLDSVIANQKALRSYYSGILKSVESVKPTSFISSNYANKSLNRTTQYPQNFSGVLGINKEPQLSSTERARQALSSLSTDITKDNYVQKPQMIESFEANPEGWNKYFESSYKSPRLAEDNKALAQRQSEGKAPGTQLVASNLAIRSESGTGVGRETVGLNPFGKLDAGLNI